MPALIFLSLLLLVGVLAYVWGPDDNSRGKRFSAREKSALSVALGLGFAVPILAQSYYTAEVMMFGTVLVSLLTAAVAGRRPLLHAYLANALILEWAFALRFFNGARMPTDVLTFFSGSIAILTIACFFLMVLSTVMYPIWQRRRKSDLAKRKATQLAAPVVAPGVITLPPPTPQYQTVTHSMVTPPYQATVVSPAPEQQQSLTRE